MSSSSSSSPRCPVEGVLVVYFMLFDLSRILSYSALYLFNASKRASFLSMLLPSAASTPLTYEGTLQRPIR